MKNIAIKTISIIIILSGLFLFSGPHDQAWADITPSPDAIGLRVYPNTEHYSAKRWYFQQGFSGSPQVLTVDGYEAVRDGQTVYINAANISGNAMYSNIYVLSYNQLAEKVTGEIFNRVLAKWKFNPSLARVGKCSIFAKACRGDADCTDSACVNGKCAIAEPPTCRLDADCPADSYCSSDKAKVIRDTRRLSDLAEIRFLLNKYKAENGRFPGLEAGTYLPGKTISAWPSWKQTLGTAMKISALPVDPINSLGECGQDRFDITTCWDNEKKEYSAGNPAGHPPALPGSSFAYAYAALDSGANYEICANMETGYQGSRKCYSGIQ